MSKIIVQKSEDEEVKETLLKLIEKKRKQLKKLNVKLYKLEEEVDGIQNEYDQRIGTLFRRDKLCDLEISRLFAINRLMRQGLTLKDAQKAVEEEFSGKKTTNSNEKKWDFYEEAMQRHDDQRSKPDNLRLIWKKLVQKFHPDLTTNGEDKAEREKIMKLINKAYNESDVETLKKLEEKEQLENEVYEKNITTPQLEQLLEQIVNASLKLQKRFDSLKKTEWYEWLKKPVSEREDLFRHFEKSLLRTVLHKEMKMQNMKQSLGIKEEPVNESI